MITTQELKKKNKNKLEQYRADQYYLSWGI